MGFSLRHTSIRFRFSQGVSPLTSFFLNSIPFRFDFAQAKQAGNSRIQHVKERKQRFHTFRDQVASHCLPSVGDDSPPHLIFLNSIFAPRIAGNSIGMWELAQLSSSGCDNLERDDMDLSPDGEFSADFGHWGYRQDAPIAAVTYEPINSKAKWGASCARLAWSDC